MTIHIIMLLLVLVLHEARNMETGEEIFPRETVGS
jgi:hypothetical protein